MLWVTRDYVHVDRVASPWLIKRFIDARAQFVFLPRTEINHFVEKTGAIPYDTGTDIELDHHECDGEKHCTFDAIVEKYNLMDDPALERLRKIVRAADTIGPEAEPRAWALELVAVGAPLLVKSDHEALELEFPVYDALYAYFQYEIVKEKYADEMKKLQSRGERQEFAKKKMAELPSKLLTPLVSST
ncbi:MAG: chromate resistance protein ChrB domain-containing protein [Candidatus Thorarchaeota archaeon]